MDVWIIHQWSGSPKSDWIPWLAKELEKKNYSVHVPEMPEADFPRIDAWIGYLADTIGILSEETIFVGHSIGAQAIMRYCERMPVQVRGAVFAAPWLHLQNLEDKEAEAIADPWLTIPIHFEAVRHTLPKIIALFSGNDPFVPIADRQLFEKHLGAHTRLIEEAGHFTADDGYAKFPELLNAVFDI